MYIFSTSHIIGYLGCFKKHFKLMELNTKELKGKYY